MQLTTASSDGKTAKHPNYTANTNGVATSLCEPSSSYVCHVPLAQM
jgi:hypothetical protein